MQYYFRAVLFILFFQCFVGSVSSQGFVQLKNRRFWLNEQPFFIKGINYKMDLVYNGPNDYYLAPAYLHGDNINTNCASLGCSSMVCQKCTTAVACSLQIVNELTRIKNMGFNTIRLCYDPKFQVNPDSLSSCPNLNSVIFPMMDKNSTDCRGGAIKFIDNNISIHDTQVIIDKFKEILNISEQIGLKVILLAGDIGWYWCNDPSTQWCIQNSASATNFIKSFHATWFAQVASQLKNYTSLLAYDISNEANSNYHLEGGFTTKKEWCKITSDLFGVLKANDPNHLTCMGTLSTEAFDYAADATNVDFMAWHFYPVMDYNQNYNDVNYAVNQTLNWLYYTSKTCQLPWIIGEFSVSGEDFQGNEGGVNYTPWMDANHQKQYVEQILPEIAKSDAAGYCWWYWCDAPQDNYGNTIKNLSARFMGVIDLEDNDKPVTQAFTNFNNSNTVYTPNTIVKPSNYLNPLNLTSPTTLNTNIKFNDPNTGSLTGIPNSFVLSWDGYSNNSDPNDVISWFNQTLAISNSNGEITLYRGNSPGVPPFGFSHSPFWIVWAGTNGYSTYRISNAESILSTQDILVYPETTYNLKSNSITNNSIRGQNTLTVDGVISPIPNQIVEITAGKEIHFTVGTELNKEVHAFIAPTNPDCDEPNLLRKRNITKPKGNDVSNGISFSAENEFHNEEKYPLPELINIYPNPNNGIFTIENKYSDQFNYILDDATGRTLKKGIIEAGNNRMDFKGISTGIYILKLQSNLVSKLKVINIQNQ